MTVTASAPGSVMLTGEHAVVYGHPALVCAIEHRVTVRLLPLPGRAVEIHSDIAAATRTTLDDLRAEGPMRFVQAALLRYRSRLPGGVAIHIASEIDPTLGLGSSAAVTVATLAALNALSEAGATPAELHLQALGIIRQLQGRGSGADLAASLFGGVLSYQLPGSLLSGVPTDPDLFAHIQPVPAPPPLSLCYVGYKTPTGDVLAAIARRMSDDPVRFEALYDHMGQCSTAATRAIRNRDWPGLAVELKRYQALMSDLGVSDDNLNRIVASAGVAMATKISGSGLGDCVLAMGEVPEGFTPVRLAQDGVRIND